MASNPVTTQPALQDLAERALAAIKRRNLAGEVHVTGVSGLSAEYAAGKLRNCSSGGRLHLSLRVVKNGRVGFCTTTDVSDPAAAVERSILAASVGEEAALAFSGQSPEGAGAPATLQLYDPAVAALTPSQLAAQAGDLYKSVGAVTPGAEVRTTADRDIEQTLLLNTSGAAISRVGTRCSTGALVTRCAADDVLMIWEDRGSARIDDLVFAELAPRLGELYSAASTRATLPAGKPRVVLSPEAGHTLLMPLMYGVDGMNANRGISPLVGRVGQGVLAKSFTLVDDPWVDWSPLSARHDDEGVPATRKEIFSRGVFGGFLHDLRSAALGGRESTGNGRRDRGQAPRIAPHNLSVQPGTLELGQLLAEAEGGLYVVSVIGGGPGALAGAFSHPVGVGYLIRDGKLAGRVKDVAISGNCYEVLGNGLVGLENRKYSRVAYGAALHLPHMLLEGVSVSGK